MKLIAVSILYLIFYFAGAYNHDKDIVRECAEKNEFKTWSGDVIRCQPITTHTSLDSAMEQVHKHQEKTGVLNNYNKVVGR